MAIKVLKNNLFFLIPYLITLLVIAPVLLLFSKPDIHIWLNRYNSPFFDWFFSHITLLGDGLFVIIPGVLLLFFSLRSTAYLVTSYLGTGLIAQILKRFVFEDCSRPLKYFNDMAPLHLADGVRLLSGHSFPSGHATSAFAIFLCLAVILRNKYLQLICFVLASTVAFSRVYLSQHFLIDIFAGSLIGTLGTLALYPLFYRKELKWHHWTLKNMFHHE